MHLFERRESIQELIHVDAERGELRLRLGMRGLEVEVVESVQEQWVWFRENIDVLRELRKFGTRHCPRVEERWTGARGTTLLINSHSLLMWQWRRRTREHGKWDGRDRDGGARIEIVVRQGDRGTPSKTLQLGNRLDRCLRTDSIQVPYSLG